MEINHSVIELNRRFGVPGVAEIAAGNGELPKVSITSSAAMGEMYLHGAQVTSWRPAGAKEVLFLSTQSRWQEGQAIRGGIPICFPWFRGKTDDPHAPAHGFVRTKAWQLESITQRGDAISVSMSTGSDDSTKRWWPAEFRLVHRATFGSELRLELELTNRGTTSIRFEEALHSYLRVADVHDARVHGLDAIPYLDNTDANREKVQQGDLAIVAETDSAYLTDRPEIELRDSSAGRRIRLTKQNSLTTVVWNPWETGARALADLGAGEWTQMLCIEASNVLGCAIDLPPGEQHLLTAVITTESWIPSRA